MTETAEIQKQLSVVRHQRARALEIRNKAQRHWTLLDIDAREDDLLDELNFLREREIIHV